MPKNSLEKFKIESVDKNLLLVNIRIPESISKSNSRIETWLAMLTQALACNFQNYKLVVNKNIYHQITDVEIEFKNIEDSTLFKLQKTDIRF